MSEVQAIEIAGPVFTPVDVQRHTIEDFKEAFGDLMTTDVPISALVGAEQVGKAVGDVTHAVRALMDGVQLLGPAIVGQVVPDAAEAERARTAVETITSRSVPRPGGRMPSATGRRRPCSVRSRP